jgi:SAM-dependent methyltransferase
MINDMTSFILKHLTWLAVPFRSPSATFEVSNQASTSSVRVLDYACGPGTITNALAAHATEYIGIDISDGMVNAYNTRFQPSPEGEDKQDFVAHAVVGNLLETPVPPHLCDDEYFNFDLAVVGMGFHHLSDVQLATTRLVERLKPGGVLMIIDFVAYDPEGQHVNHISHHGFSEERVREVFGQAGLVDVGIVKAEKDWKIMEKHRRAFMARGRKPTG